MTVPTTLFLGLTAEEVHHLTRQVDIEPDDGELEEAVGKYEEVLHPRGRGGKWIRKLGPAKLTPHANGRPETATARGPGGGGGERRTDLVRLAPLDASTEAGYRRYTDAIRANPRAEFVTLPSRAELATKRVWLSDDGLVGVTVSQDGEVGNLFANPGAPPGAGGRAVDHAVANGGTWLNCFDGKLPDIYKRHGFVEVARIPFNREFKPEGWDVQTQDDPDIVFMGHGVAERPVQRFEDWDEAERAVLDRVAAGPAADRVIESLNGKTGDEAYQALASGAATDTQHIYQVDGKYTAERQRLHQQIIDHFFANARPAKGKATAIFTAGGAASGKSALAGQASPERNLDIPDGAVYINPDDIKALMPEYKELQQRGRADVAAAATHEESSDIAKLMTALAMQGNYPIIVDGTGNSKGDKFDRKLHAALDAGYNVEARYAHVPVEEALAREKKRAERTGRKVAESLLRNQHRTVAQSYTQHVLKTTGVHIKVYSTVERGRPTLIAEKPPGGALRVIDEQQYNDHVAKAEA